MVKRINKIQMKLLDEINKVPEFTKIPPEEFYAQRLDEMLKEAYIHFLLREERDNH